MSELFFMRPVVKDDLSGLMELADTLGGAVTTLPPDRDSLAARIDDSVAAFGRRIRSPGAEWYLFVLCDAAGRVRGTSGIIGRVGGFDPYYAYEVRREVHEHPPLGIHREVRVLHLRREHKGPSELASLALDPALRSRGLGRLLSLSRMLFIAAQRERFAEVVIAELRGYQDPEGRSPFWESVGRHFFDREFAEADFLSGLGNKDFIEDLMPRHPIYLSLLPPEVQEAVGRPHTQTEPALHMLEREGLVRSGEIDIFDAGPIVAGRIDDLRTVRDHARLRVRRLTERPPDGPVRLVGNGRNDFRAALAAVGEEGEDAVALSRAAAAALEVGLGDVVQVVRA